ncbi:hypothetical protein EBR96_00825 [bacterium]|nr:hypothetical protein [bacterium]
MHGKKGRLTTVDRAELTPNMTAIPQRIKLDKIVSICPIDVKFWPWRSDSGRWLAQWIQYPQIITTSHRI